MSARKVTSRYLNTPGSGIKSSTKTKPPTPKQSLNATTISKSPPTLKAALHANTTLNIGGPQFLPKIMATDWTLQCDLVYSEYLRALITKDVFQVLIKGYEEEADDQLSRQAELLQRALSEQSKLESEIKDLEIQIEIEKLSIKLQESYSTISEIIQDYNVNANVNECIVASENACNKLYLKNIKCFKSQEDYDKFATLLQNCTETMKKLKTAVSNTDDMQVLGERIKTFLELQDEFIKKQKMLFDLQSYVAFGLFKNMSNKFAVIRGYNEE